MSRSASSPLPTPIAWRVSQYAANSSSKAVTSGPRMNWPEAMTRCGGGVELLLQLRVGGRDVEEWDPRGGHWSNGGR